MNAQERLHQLRDELAKATALRTEMFAGPALSIQGDLIVSWTDNGYVMVAKLWVPHDRSYTEHVLEASDDLAYMVSLIRRIQVAASPLTRAGLDLAIVQAALRHGTENRPPTRHGRTPTPN